MKHNRDAFVLSWLPIIYLLVRSPAVQRVGLCTVLFEAVDAQKMLSEVEM